MLIKGFAKVSQEQSKKKFARRLLRSPSTNSLKTVLRLFFVGFFVTSALSAQTEDIRFYERFRIDAGAYAIAPPAAVPAAFGAVVGLGFALKDIDIEARFLYLMADIARNPVMVPNLLIDYKIPTLPNLLTLLPYISGGLWMAKVLNTQTGEYGSSRETMYAEAGLGAEVVGTDALSLVARVGWGYALLYDKPYSINTTGPTVSLVARYSFGRVHTLAY